MPAEDKIRLFGLNGSLRKESFSRAILKTLAEAIADKAQIDISDIGTLPLYNQDEDTDKPLAPVAAMRTALAASKGILIISPEYNHGMTGVLKNALDWLSRPTNKSALIGKPALVISSSPGAMGGVRSQPQLRETLLACMARPIVVNEIVISSAADKISNGRLTDKASLDYSLKALNQLIEEAKKA